ncbi:MAG: class I SAM-dependent methyltransferase [Acidimicrobiia bacterium]|nr:class I SAM-dependent methyltransferase [Acidimicrobiia bacterium]
MSLDATRRHTFTAHDVTLRSTPADRWALKQLQRSVHGVPVRFVLWDGVASGPKTAPLATVHFKRRRALWSWLWDPQLYVGETYMAGAVDGDGDLRALLEAMYRVTKAPRGWSARRQSITLQLARSNVHHHYDLGNEFYRLWLDRELVYTCAYFPRRDVTLDEAQAAKMDLVCRKLRLQPGERVVEAGCGWGALALHMARHYGVTVDAFNLSSAQLAWARERAASEGLADRARFFDGDYRTVTGTYDVFVSVGMIEHVGLNQLGALAHVMDRVMTPNGRGLLHFIGRNRPAPLNRWIRKRIFPGGYPPTLRELCEHVLEPADFSVLDVENLRLHYALTLRHWRERFEQSADRVRTMFDEPFVRAWRLYLTGSEAAFTTGWMQLFQVVISRGTSNAVPWTRVSG